MPASIKAIAALAFIMNTVIVETFMHVVTPKHEPCQFCEVFDE